MKIQDIFAKPIDRNIKGVITIGDDRDDNIKQELEEYVVTRELKNHFNDFFQAYVESINNNTTNMGVWISGFFGSGKSHFLKILSYLLENREVKGKPAIDYFLDDSKIVDPITIDNMKKSTAINNEVMLFNIDSKARSGNKTQKDAILNVFLQVFNEQLGLSGESFWLADLERQLIKDNRYEDFKDEFTKVDSQSRDWVGHRNEYAFMTGTIKETLVNIGFMTEADAQGFVDSLSSDYAINVEDFAKMVNEYIKKQSDDYHMVFLIDEIGQYIGDSQQRMLNLQSIVEDLGTYTQGKAWVIVTSQQAIDQVTDNINGQDFSKIQGRFHTRISMSSANVDEVIKKRLLTKTSESQSALENTYNDEQHSINNLIDFDGDVERKKYDNASAYSEVYPFVPYQFVLLQETLTAIRENGSDGKHLAEGERSMLAVFQESAQYFENRDIRSLIPFSVFFRGLEQFLDHTHAIVIQHAIDNEKINPNKEVKPFAVEVLETLFMVKYVKNFDATLNNVTTLMIDSIDTDRIELENKVKKALAVLINQELVEKTVHGYEFLTDAEQDISKQINKQNVDAAEISRSIGDQLFAGSNISRKFVYPKLNNQYTFSFNPYVDDYPVASTINEMSIRIFTSESDYHRDESSLTRISADPSQLSVVVDMPEDDSYIEDMRQAIKIRKFALEINNNLSDSRSQKIFEMKKTERGTLNAKASSELLTSLQNADIYVNGKKMTNNGKDFYKRLADAEEALIDDVYRSFSYIEVTKNEKDIINLFKNDELKVKTTENEQAKQAILDHITRSFDGRSKLSYKSILDKFSHIPYGYIDVDIKWLVASLYVNSKIKLYVNNAPVSLNFTSDDVEIAKYFTKKTYVDKVQFEPRREISATKKKDLEEIADEVFNKRTFSNDEDDTVMNELKSKVKKDLKNLELYQVKPNYYPGKNFIETGISMLRKLNDTPDTDNFYDYASKIKDDLLDWHDDMDEFGIYEFYQSETQQEIWEVAHRKLDIYNNSKDFITGVELPDIVEDIEQIVNSNKPQDKIHQLKDLSTQFDNQYNLEFDRKLDSIKGDIEIERQNVLDYAEKNETIDQLKAKINQRFDSFIKEAEDSINLDKLVVVKDKVLPVGSRFREDTDRVVAKRMEAERAEKLAKIEAERRKNNENQSDTTGDTSLPEEETRTVSPESKTKPARHISIRSLQIPKNWPLKNEDDVDEQLSLLKKVLMKELKDNNDNINLSL
ncbi:BREX system P-loop protein BrxC [Companilactobacillus furfuricola]|uniref:BREX system P-loop protein BrxC n=1 Tax=Companilactobacillus furfuricola TaxID=1462575 RepID=UPI000F7AF814|nr:BREX system P-loop protein BrxC [Companilactobacillus furfuricola]